MKLFISWSGRTSEQIARLLSKFLPRILPEIEPLISHNIRKGSFWPKEVVDQLQDAKAGIVCLTPDNHTNPWLIFEAGALAKGYATVLPVLFGCKPEDIGEPLSYFQMCSYGKEEFRQLIEQLNHLCHTKALTEVDLEEKFLFWWPRVRAKLNAILFSANWRIAREPGLTYFRRLLFGRLEAALFMLIGIALIYCAVRFGYKYEDPYKDTWTSTKGTLIEFAYRQIPSEETLRHYKSDRVPVADLKVSYAYVADSKEYEDSTISILSNFVTLSEVNSFIDSVGKEMSVYYEIANPQNGSLVKPRSYMMVLFLLMGVAGVAGAIFGIGELKKAPSWLDRQIQQKESPSGSEKQSTSAP